MGSTAPQRGPCANSQSLCYVALHGTGSQQMRFSRGTCRGERTLGRPRRADVVTGCHKREVEAELSQESERDAVTEAQAEMIPAWAGKVHKTRTATGFRSGKCQGTDSPIEPPEATEFL